MQNNAESIKILPKEIQKVIIPLDYKYANTGDLVVKTGDYVSKNSALTKSLSFDSFSIALHSPIDGVVTNIGNYPVLTADNIYQTKKVKCIEIIKKDDCQFQNKYSETYTRFLDAQHGSNLSTRITKIINETVPHSQKITKSNLLSKLSENGIIGLGGAGFPSSKKIATQNINLLLINGVECEAPINVDNILMQNHANDLINGINLLINILKPNKTILALKESMPHSISSIKRELIKENESEIKLQLIPNRYPNGYSKTLLSLVSPLRVNNKFHSSDHGIICLNVATVYSIWNAIIKQQPLTKRLVTITGDIKNEGTYLLPVGTCIDHILQSFEIDFNLIKNHQKTLKVKIGGDYMGYNIFDSQTDDINIAVGYFNSVGIDQTTQAIHIEYKTPRKKRTSIIKNIQSLFLNQVQLDCINCGYCIPACPMELEPQKLYWFSKKLKNANNSEILEDYNITSCIECGLCDTVCPSNIPLSAKFKSIKSELKYEHYKIKQSKLAEVRNQLHENRLQLKQNQKNKVALSGNKSAKQDLLSAALKRAQAKKLEDNLDKSEKNN